MHVFNTLWVVFGIGLMLVLNLKSKVNSMMALLVVVLSVGTLADMDLMLLLHTTKTGFGNTLRELTIIMVSGTVIGKLMVDPDAAHQIAHTLLARLNLRYAQVSAITIGLIFGLATFYKVALTMLAPLVIIIAAEAKIPFLRLAIPAVAAATAAHSLLPPQPGLAALMNAYDASMGMAYIYDTPVTTPNIIYAGLTLLKFLGNLERPTPSFLRANQPVNMDSLPSFGVLILVPLIPAIIMTSTTIANIWLVKDTPAWEAVNFIGFSPIAMLIAMVVVFVLFGTTCDHDMQWVMNVFGSMVKSIAVAALIIGTGGVLRQTITDTGIDDTISMLMSHGNTSPYAMAWLITVLIRLAMERDAVSTMTAVGIISAAILDPTTGQLVGVNPALLVLVTAAGPNTLAHISDASFQLLKGYFDLSIKDTLKIQGLLEPVNSVVELITVLIISMAM